MLGGDLPAVAAAALTGGEAALSEFTLRVGQPVGPMLAQTATGVAEALERLGGEAVFEAKLDGARVQIHRAGDDVSIYTRSLDDVTARLPEVVEATLALPVTDLIADGEAIALRPDGRPHRFQVTASRFGRAATSRRRQRSRCRCSSSTSCISTASTCSTSPRSERLSALDAIVPADQRVDRLVTSDAAAAQALPRRDAGRRPRGRDGEVTDRAVRGGPPRRGLAEGQAGAHPRPRRARPSSGDRADAPASCPTSISAPAIRRPAISSCWARRSRA